MANLKLKKVYLRNFGSVRESEVQFPQHGFVLVLGKNYTCPGSLDSVGSGKTLLGEAFSRALFNVPGRNKRLSEFSTNDEGNTLIKVEATIEDQDLVVELGYRCKELNPGGEGLRFSLGNQPPVMFGDMTDTRRELSKIVGMSANVAEWTVYIDGSKISFSELSESASVSLLMGALNQPPWTEYQRKAAKVYSRFNDAYNEADGRHSATKTSMNAAQLALDASLMDLAEAEHNLKNAHEIYVQKITERDVSTAAIKASIQKCSETLVTIKKRIAKLEEQEAAKYHELEITHQRAVSTHGEMQRLQSKLEREYGDLREVYEKLKGDKQAAAAQYHVAAFAERNKLLAEKARIEKLNEMAKSSHAVEERSLFTTMNRVQSAEVAARWNLQQAAEALAREKSVPSICPLEGCGKIWPSTNQHRVVEAESKVEKATQALDLAERNLALAKEAHAKLAPIALTPLPDIPEESSIPPFPDESLWNDKISSHYSVTLEVHQKLSAQITIVDGAEQAATAAKAKLNELKSSSQVIELSGEYQCVENSRNGHQMLLDKYMADVIEKPDESKVAQASVRVNERKTTLDQHVKTLEQTALDLSECMEAKKAADYWVEAFSPSGIPNLIINESVTPLNSVSKKVSLRMTGGMLEVSYSTKHKLKTQNREVNELSILVKNKHGATRVSGASKGETGLLDLIIAETIAEVGNVASRVGFRWYDEISQSQDATVRRAIFSYFSELARNLGILIFVVDHAVEVSSYASHVLIAEKTEAGTTYVWQ
jgi:DNA repair exonuclease SbcCD ATPase subunit